MAKSKTKKSSKSSGYRIKNWAGYNQALRSRGSLDIWIDEEVLASWQDASAKNSGKRGAPFRYPDMVVELILQLGAVFHQPLRQTQGLAVSVLGLLKLELSVPDYTTLSRRRPRLASKLLVIPKDIVAIIVDSTGLKFIGEGEWKRKKHGFGYHRMWRKLHLGADTDGEIRASLLTDNSVTDADATEPLLAQEQADTVADFFGDGAYDKRKVYEALATREVKHVSVPPQKNAKIWIHGNTKAPPHPRDENLRSIRKTSRSGWKKRSSYHTRSLSETAMFRYKRIIGERVWAKTLLAQQVETTIGAAILNRMTKLGMPKSEWQGSESISSRARAVSGLGVMT